MNMQASLFYQISCQLGEGSMWHKNRIFWIDIEKCQLHQVDPWTMAHQAWPLRTRIGTIVPDEQGHIVMGMQGYVARFDPFTGTSETLLTITGEPEDNRSNDGKCDPAGRFWLGTMSLKETANAGNLYCIFPDGQMHKKIPDTSISNGLVWTRDKTKMYYVDSPTASVQEFAYDDATGDIRYIRKAVEVPEELGSPDGMAIDENDELWIAQWGGFGVYHWDPVTGVLIEKVEVPVPQVTSCAFGGPDMKTLYITTAWKGMSDEGKAKYPLSGSVFAVETHVRGFAPYHFRG